MSNNKDHLVGQLTTSPLALSTNFETLIIISDRKPLSEDKILTGAFNLSMASLMAAIWQNTLM